MATTSTSKTKKTKDSDIITTYMDWVLQKNEEPKNVYSFCKENKIKETDFYQQFGSIEAIKSEIWLKFFENTTSMLEKDKSFETYDNRNKMLSFYFTMFEVLTLNRSYVVFSLEENKQGLKNLKQLQVLRNHFKKYIVTIIDTNTEVDDKSIKKMVKPIKSEGAWIQFLILLKFWLDDTSKGFEKTDIMIEKSVKAAFDMMDTTPLESLLDLGKFIWKEKFN